MPTHLRRSRRILLFVAAGAACLPAAAQSIEPFRPQDVKPFQAQEAKPVRAQEVKPYRAEPARPQDRRREEAAPRQESSLFFHTFGLAVPGVAYSWDNLATQTRTHVTAAGTVTKSAVRINPDGTYVWNSAWDGRVIQGRWISHKDGILLQNGQEKKDWVMGRLPHPNGDAVVYLYDGHSMTYHGTPKPGGR